LLSLYGDLRGASYQKESGINSNLLEHCAVFTKVSEEFAPHYLAEIRHDMRQTTLPSTVSSESRNEARGEEAWQQRRPGIYGVTSWKPVVAPSRVPATLAATPRRCPVKWSWGGGFRRANMGAFGLMA